MPWELGQTIGRARGHARSAAMLLRGGAAPVVWREVRKRLSSSIEYVILSRDLAGPNPAPAKGSALRLRPLRAGDAGDLLDVSRASGPDVQARLSRTRLLQTGIGTPYVALEPSGRAVHIQWLFLPRDNDALAAYSRQFFPRLAPDEVLIEGLFTEEAARGRGITTWALGEVASAAREQGASRVLMFVEISNAASLKAAQRAGFIRCGRQCERWSLFRCRIDRTPGQVERTVAPRPQAC